MDMIALYSFAGAIAGAFASAAWKNRNVKIERMHDFPEYQEKIILPYKKECKKIMLYSASQFLDPSVKTMYIFDVLRGGIPYSYQWYETMSKVLFLLDEFRGYKFLHPYPKTVAIDSKATAITQIDLIGITRDALRKADTRNNPHLMLAVWLLFVGILEEFNEWHLAGTFAEYQGENVPGNILSVAQYMLLELESHDRLSVIKMICDIWNNRSDFINIEDVFDYSKRWGRFSATIIDPDRLKTVQRYPKYFIPSRFVMNDDCMENHLMPIK